MVEENGLLEKILKKFKEANYEDVEHVGRCYVYKIGGFKFVLYWDLKN